MKLFVTSKNEERAPRVPREASDVVDAEVRAVSESPQEEPSATGAEPRKLKSFFGRAKPAATAPAGDVAPVAAQAPTGGKKSFFGSKKATASAEPAVDTAQAAPAVKSEKTGKAPRKLKIPKFNLLPIRVVAGYLPEVSERDALEYAMGIAEKHFEQIGLVYYAAHEYDGGYAYEVHEGGEGKAFLPSILNFFRSQGAYAADEHVFAIIETATRKVEILRQRQGLAALILPETSTATATDWLVATKAMTPAINRRRPIFLAGLGLLVTGFFAMMTTGIFFRLQGYLPPEAPKVETISGASLPRTQWRQIQSLGPDAYIKAIRFRNNAWEKIELHGDEAAAQPPATDVGAGARGTETALPPIVTPALVYRAPISSQR